MFAPGFSNQRFALRLSFAEKDGGLRTEDRGRRSEDRLPISDFRFQISDLRSPTSVCATPAFCGETISIPNIICWLLRVRAFQMLTNMPDFVIPRQNRSVGLAGGLSLPASRYRQLQTRGRGIINNEIAWR